MRAKSNFKNKCTTIAKIGKDYKKGIILSSKAYDFHFENMKVKETEYNYLGFEKKDLMYYQNLVKLIDLVLESLDIDSSLILKKDFFKNDDNNWWLKYYSRSTYYRLKNKAMDNFLETVRELQII